MKAAFPGVLRAEQERQTLALTGAHGPQAPLPPFIQHSHHLAQPVVGAQGGPSIPDAPLETPPRITRGARFFPGLFSAGRGGGGVSVHTEIWPGV
jgi:hypothetical protein